MDGSESRARDCTREKTATKLWLNVAMLDYRLTFVRSLHFSREVVNIDFYVQFACVKMLANNSHYYLTQPH